jgi:ornithine cyclodeaminase/alanine dehydrogenase-like protein (mu-crystallin family)
MTICGAGTQARYHLRAFAKLFPLKRVFIFSRTAEKRGNFATAMSAELGIAVEPAADLSVARESDVILTCTTARKAFLDATMVAPGTFVGAIGADSPQKQEIAPELMAKSRVVADLVEQCAAVGELHHAIEAGFMSTEQIHAELGEVVTGRKPGRTTDDQIFIYDSTGSALQDVAAAARVFDKGSAASRGMAFNFAKS